MKIIQDKDCYVQRDDIDYLISNNEKIPSELFFELNMNVLNDSDFIKIENKIAKRFILQSDIPSFDELNSYDLNILDEMLFKLRLSIFDSDEYEDEEINAIVSERRKLEYLIRQIKEIIAFKKNISKLVYPNIPNPNFTSLSNDNLIASMSMNLGNVLIYNPNGTSVDREDDPAFCEIAYQMLMHDLDINEEIILSYENDDKYLILKNIVKSYGRKKIRH